MKKNREKGAAGMDIGVGMFIFVITSTVVVSLYYQVYVTAVTIKIHEVAIACITEVFEKVDLEPYENVNDTKVKEWIKEAKMDEYFNETKNKSKVESSVANYTNVPTEGGSEQKQDVIKIVNITLTYTISGETVTFPINKIKVKEVEEGATT